MERERILRKVGGSVMLPIPHEFLEAAGLSLGDRVTVSVEDGKLTIVATIPGPDAAVAAFAHRFTARYRSALEELAK